MPQGKHQLARTHHTNLHTHAQHTHAHTPHTHAHPTALGLLRPPTPDTPAVLRRCPRRRWTPSAKSRRLSASTGATWWASARPLACCWWAPTAALPSTTPTTRPSSRRRPCRRSMPATTARCGCRWTSRAPPPARRSPASTMASSRRRTFGTRPSTFGSVAPKALPWSNCALCTAARLPAACHGCYSRAFPLPLPPSLPSSLQRRLCLCRLALGL